MKILVTGATGFIGQALCRLLATEGHEFNVLSRRPESVALPNSKAFRWNPEAETPPAEAWAGVEAVIHLAGEPVADKRWTEEQKRRIRDSRVVGTRNLVAGLKAQMKKAAQPPKVFISGSAVGFYGNRGDEKVDEHSAPGTGFFPDICTAFPAESRTWPPAAQIHRVAPSARRMRHSKFQLACAAIASLKLRSTSTRSPGRTCLRNIS